MLWLARYARLQASGCQCSRVLIIDIELTEQSRRFLFISFFILSLLSKKNSAIEKFILLPHQLRQFCKSIRLLFSCKLPLPALELNSRKCPQNRTIISLNDEVRFRGCIFCNVNSRNPEDSSLLAETAETVRTITTTFPKL